MLRPNRLHLPCIELLQHGVPSLRAEGDAGAVLAVWIAMLLTLHCPQVKPNSRPDGSAVKIARARRNLEQALQVKSLANQRRGRQQVVGVERLPTGRIVEVSPAAGRPQPRIDLKPDRGPVEHLLA